MLFLLVRGRELGQRFSEYVSIKEQGAWKTYFMKMTEAMLGFVLCSVYSNSEFYATKGGFNLYMGIILTNVL